MEWKEWLSAISPILALVMVIYWKYFDRNNDVFNLHIENLKDTIDRIVKEFKEERDELKDDIKSNTESIGKLSNTLIKMTKHWDVMADKYEEERNELIKRNALTDKQNELLEMELKNKEKMMQFKEDEFKKMISELAENTYKVLIEHTNYEHKTRS